MPASGCQRSIKESEPILHNMKTFSTYVITIRKKDIERKLLYAYRQDWEKLEKNFELRLTLIFNFDLVKFAALLPGGNFTG